MNQACHLVGRGVVESAHPRAERLDLPAQVLSGFHLIRDDFEL